jgi:hypothetical protein
MKADKLLTIAQMYLCPKSYMRSDGSEVLFKEDWDARKKELWQRCGGRCEQLNALYALRCRRLADDPHHVIARSKRRDDRLTNLIALCRWHHNALDERKPRWTKRERANEASQS